MNESEKLLFTKIAVNFRGVPVFNNSERFLSALTSKYDANPLLKSLDTLSPGTRSGFLSDMGRESVDPKIQGMSSLGNIFLNPIKHEPRSTLAHEWFHSAIPVVGRSETLARFYGGYTQPRNAGLLQRLRSGSGAVNRYYTRDIEAYSPVAKWLKNKLDVQSRVPQLQLLDRSLANPPTFNPRTNVEPLIPEL